MKSITLKLTTEELRLLATLASDQLFRKEFIDPRMPGYRSNAAEISLGKALVGRLRLMVSPASAAKAPAPRVASAPRVTVASRVALAPRTKGPSGAAL